MSPLDRLIDAARAALGERLALPLGTPLAAACSGGADSVALVDTLSRLSGEWPLTAVIHIDHGLRDGSADLEAARRAAARASAPFVATQLPPGSLAHGNLQATARAARYDALLALAPPDALIATAHTADDQTETILMRVARGTGLGGLRAIRPRDGRVVRPLLDVTRDETRAAAAGLHAEDPSNTDPRFSRSRLRAEVIPPLLSAYPALHAATARLRDAADGELALIEALLGDRVPPLTTLPAPALAALFGHLSRRLLPDGPPSHAALEALASAVARGLPDASATLGNGLGATWRAGRLRLGPDRDPRRAVLVHAPGVTRIGGIVVELAPTGVDVVACEDESEIPDRDWPLRVRDTGGAESLVEIRGASGVLLWPAASGVSTLRKSDAAGRVFRITARASDTLTVERDGHLRLGSEDRAPPTRLGR